MKLSYRMPEDEVDHEDGDQEQEAQALQRALEGLRRALEARAERGGQPSSRCTLLDLGHRVAQRHAGLAG